MQLIIFGVAEHVMMLMTVDVLRRLKGNPRSPGTSIEGLHRPPRGSVTLAGR